MTDKKISQLDLVSGVSPADEMIINVGGGDTATTSRVSLETLLGGNEVSGIQYSAVFTSSMPGAVKNSGDLFQSSFHEVSKDPNNPDITAPIYDWIDTTESFPVPENADGAIVIAYTATSQTPHRNIINHPAYVAGSSAHTSIVTKLAHRFYLKEENGTPVVMDPDFSGEPGMMGWTDTHNNSVRLADAVVDQGDVGNQKRGNFQSVKQITKIGFCRFNPGQTELSINYKLHIYRAEFQELDIRPLRFIILPTQGVTSSALAPALDGETPVDDPFVPYSIKDINDEITLIHSQEIRHIMTMMDAYERANPSPGIPSDTLDDFNEIRADLLALGSNNAPTPGPGETQDQVNGKIIKESKEKAFGLMFFDLGYNTNSTGFGLLS